MILNQPSLKSARRRSFSSRLVTPSSSHRKLFVTGLACLLSTRSALPSVESLSSPTTSIAGARQLGKSDLVVSEACLGTMTFGIQNTREDAFAQIDIAREKYGVNFIDTAELYPVPLTVPEWRAGKTEEIVGDYLKHIGPSGRDELVVATKIAGFFPNSPVAAARGTMTEDSDKLPDCRLDAKSVREACEASLKRLKTDRIDLFQLHWPDRYVPVFGQTEFKKDQMRQESIPIRETAEALKTLMEEGKIRAIGLSNESPYGLCQWIRATEELGIRDCLASIQNSYSLVDRRFDSDLAEICAHEDIGLLPWSILAGGLLSGKYRKEVESPSPNSRFKKFPDYMKRWNPDSASAATLEAVDEYAEIAKQAGMSMAELSVQFVRSRRFISDNGSVIVGATTIEQLEENLTPFLNKQELDEEVLEAINGVHMKCRDPSCVL